MKTSSHHIRCWETQRTTNRSKIVMDDSVTLDLYHTSTSRVRSSAALILSAPRYFVTVSYKFRSQLKRDGDHFFVSEERRTAPGQHFSSLGRKRWKGGRDWVSNDKEMGSELILMKHRLLFTLIVFSIASSKVHYGLAAPVQNQGSLSKMFPRGSHWAVGEYSFLTLLVTIMHPLRTSTRPVKRTDWACQWLTYAVPFAILPIVILFALNL